uniref:HTH_48 domain-containing protein n=1 Tax=Heterorhabditis bacteriophora TaxID=37862 RepID=A0A1I7WA43_HETBA
MSLPFIHRTRHRTHSSKFIIAIILTAFVEYEHLLLATEITLSTSGGAQKLFVEASLLSSKHRHLFLRRYDECTRFNNAHDIYEILTAGGIVKGWAYWIQRHRGDAENRDISPSYCAEAPASMND